MKNKELLAEYKKCLESSGFRSDEWVKQVDQAFKIRGKILTISKPRIQTEYVVGYSDIYGPSYQEAQDIARRFGEEAGFLEINEESLRLRLEKVKSSDIYIYPKYAHDNGIWKMGYENDDVDGKVKLTVEEKQVVIDNLNESLMRFEKRLISYLKRYGNSKLSWRVYWLDD